jgi:hypothetical protein
MFSLDSLELDAVVFAAPKKYNDHYSVNLSVGDEKLLIQSPKFKLNADLDLPPDNKFVDVLCGSSEFLVSLKHVDDTMANVIKANRETWFPGKNIDDTFVEVGQVPSVLSSNTIRLRVNKHLQVFDSDSKCPLEADRVDAGTDAKCIMHLAGLWFTATRWGLTWNLVQMKTYPTQPKKIYKGYMFPDDDEENEQQPEDDTNPTPPPGV